MRTIEYLYHGSSDMPYHVTFICDGQAVRARCTCPAGDHQTICKHIMQVLDGDIAKTEGTTAEQATELLALVESSDVQPHRALYIKADRIAVTAAEEAKKRKRGFARKLLGG
jgi:uncharacterized Zn finger protein